MVKKQKEVKIFSFDIETMANTGYYFQLYKEGNIVQNIEHWYMISFAWKWLGEKETHVLALPDFKSYKKNKKDDKELAYELWKKFDEADIVIAHNGQAFDVKKANALFLKHGFQPPSPYKVVDTKLVAKRYFRFDSNKLDDLADFLKIGRKLQTGGFQLWLDCENGIKKAWDKMKEYNKHDVVLLEKVYLRMVPFISAHPTLNRTFVQKPECRECQSRHMHSRGVEISKGYARNKFNCRDCGAWTLSEKILT